MKYSQKNMLYFKKPLEIFLSSVWSVTVLTDKFTSFQASHASTWNLLRNKKGENVLGS